MATATPSQQSAAPADSVAEQVDSVPGNLPEQNDQAGESDLVKREQAFLVTIDQRVDQILNLWPSGRRQDSATHFVKGPLSIHHFLGVEHDGGFPVIHCGNRETRRVKGNLLNDACEEVSQLKSDCETFLQNAEKAKHESPEDWQEIPAWIGKAPGSLDRRHGREREYDNDEDTENEWKHASGHMTIGQWERQRSRAAFLTGLTNSGIEVTFSPDTYSESEEDRGHHFYATPGKWFSDDTGPMWISLDDREESSLEIQLLEGLDAMARAIQGELDHLEEAMTWKVGDE